MPLCAIRDVSPRHARTLQAHACLLERLGGQRFSPKRLALKVPHRVQKRLCGLAANMLLEDLTPCAVRHLLRAARPSPVAVESGRRARDGAGVIPGPFHSGLLAGLDGLHGLDRLRLFCLVLPVPAVHLG